MSENRAVFTKFKNRYVIVHIVDSKAEHIYAYDSLNRLEIGTIINCRIDRQAGNIGSCFAAYTKNDLAFVQSDIKSGTVLPLMYKKEAYENKKSVFSKKLSISGKYVIVHKDESFIKASSKIDEETKKEYIASFEGIIQKAECGIILRTQVFNEENGLNRAAEEYRMIKKRLEEIRHDSMHLPQYSVLYRPAPAYVSDILWLIGLGITEIVTDDKEIEAALNAEHDSLSGPVTLSDRVSTRFYDDKLLPLCNLYSFNAKISEVLSRKVYLKSGAFITFDHTEALCAVDVNSSHNDRKGDRNDTFFSINCEASVEIARQLKLRNISGMIIIDFINMDDDKLYDRLAALLSKELKKDRIRCRLIDFTKLHLAEIIRDRKGRSLYSIMGD